MKKNIQIFVAGVVMGAIVVVVCLISIKKDFEIVLFEQGEKILPIHKLKVFQVIDKDRALVREGGLLHKIMPKTTYLLLNNNGYNWYYDDQEIQVSKEEKVKQVGVYRYSDKKGAIFTIPKILTIPAIRIESMKTENK